MIARKWLRIAAPVFSLLLGGCFIYYQTAQVKKQAASSQSPVLLSSSKKGDFVLGDGAGVPGSLNAQSPATQPVMILSGSKSNAGSGMLLPSSKGGVVLPPSPGSESQQAPWWVLSGSKSVILVPPTTSTKPATQPGTQPESQPATRLGG